MEQKWQYSFCTVQTKAGNLQSALDVWAADGWELVSTNHTNGFAAFVLFWRRPANQ
jgi:hypothetical protein